MLRRRDDDCSCLRLARFDGVQHSLVVASPGPTGDLADQAARAVAEVVEATESSGLDLEPYQQTVFVAEPELEAGCRALLETLWGDRMPATVVVAQPPLDGSALAIEAWCAGSTRGESPVERLPGGLVRVRHDRLALVHGSQASPRPGTVGAFNQGVSALSCLRRNLARAGIDFHQVLRTWFYQGAITDDEGATQRYKELNRARAAFYEGIHFLAECCPPERAAEQVFPASTGIGASGRDLALAAIALQTASPEVRAVPLENPHQTSAFQYAARFSPKSPQFARAMALASGPDTTIYISGTASITASESRHLGDIDGQTHQTLDNIEALVAEPNLRHHNLPGRGATLADLVHARVYVKRADDLARTRAICRERLGDVPVLYTLADVCRPELLVEIEGLTITGPAASG